MHKLTAQLLSGFSLRLMECLRLKEIDIEYPAITVRNGNAKMTASSPCPKPSTPKRNELLASLLSLLGKPRKEGGGLCHILPVTRLGFKQALF